MPPCSRKQRRSRRTTLVELVGHRLDVDVPHQLTTEEMLESSDREQLLAETTAGPDMERLGESDAYADVIFKLHEQAGWRIHFMTPFAGVIDDAGTVGVLMIAAHPDVGLPIEITGRRCADCAMPLLLEAQKHVRTIANAGRRRAAAARQAAA
ncbi:MAG: hypothetical protein ACJ76I_11790 [Gaiellaceae bacterium]